MEMENWYKQRNLTIDILRALVMLLMIFVNDLWMIEGEPEWLGHSSAMQDFMGLADIVFPCFLIVVGMSIPYALEGRFAKGESGVKIVGHVLSRSFALIVMGVFTVNSESFGISTMGLPTAWFRILMVVAFIMIWNAYPRTASTDRQRTFSILKWIGAALLIMLAITCRHPDGGVFQSSWWGILGLIGWTYLVCAMIYIFVRDRIGYLLIAWGAFALLCLLSSPLLGGGTLLSLPTPNILQQVIDILQIGTGCHVALTMSGVIFTIFVAKYRQIVSKMQMAMWCVLIAACSLCLGVVCDLSMITSKILATAPWMFFNIAIAVFAYTVINVLVEMGKARWFDCVKPAGIATLTCYLMPYVTSSIMALCGVELPLWMRTGTMGILTCIADAFFTIWLTYGLTRLHIKLKI